LCINNQNLERLLQNVQDARMDSMMAPARLIVKHGGVCQAMMRCIGSGLSNGATRYWGAYVCDKHPDFDGVIITLEAPADIPFQIFSQEDS